MKLWLNKVNKEIQPDGVIHCAAWTAVDVTEDEENKVKVYSVNVRAAEYIVKVCKKLDCKKIYIYMTTYLMVWERNIRRVMMNVSC